MRIRLPTRWALTVALALAVLAASSYYVLRQRTATAAHLAFFDVDSPDAQRSADPQILLAAADHFYFLNNGPAAAPLYARSEKLFSERADPRNELHAKVGRLRSETETMSFVDLSQFLNEQLKNPIVQGDRRLQLWCLIAKGYTDIEIDYRATSEIGWTPMRLQMSWVKSNGQLGLPANWA